MSRTQHVPQSLTPGDAGGIARRGAGEGWKRTTTTLGWLFSHSLEATDWPGLRIVCDDLVGFVRELKRTDDPQLRTLGSLSLVRQLLAAGLVDRFKLVVCPLILPQTGVEPTLEGLPDMGFDLPSTRDKVL